MIALNELTDITCTFDESIQNSVDFVLFIEKCNFLRLSFTNKQKINFPLLNEMSARWRYFIYERTWEFAE